MGLITDFIISGLAAERPFDPNTDPGLGAGTSMYYLAKDTGVLSVWNQVDAVWYNVGRSPFQVNIDSTTARTLSVADENTHIRFVNAGLTTVTVPENGTVAMTIGSIIKCTAVGAGGVLISPENGAVILNSRDKALKSAGVNSIFFLEKVDTNSWEVHGDVNRPANGSEVITDTSAAYVLDNDHKGSYRRMTKSDGDKTVTVQPHATEAIDDQAEFHFRVSGNQVTFVQGTDVTINPPAGGTLVATDGMTVTLKKVATNTYDLIGQVVLS